MNSTSIEAKAAATILDTDSAGSFWPFNPLETLPKKRRVKRKKKRNLSEHRAKRGRVISLPALAGAFSGTPQGQRLCGRLSLVSFFGETKKETGCRAAPGLVVHL